ncbi:MAG: hypothetical protein HQK68_07230 [Desulfamplus sp.]|nr:hypothetical protein [Desulfamplus sp.]
MGFLKSIFVIVFLVVINLSISTSALSNSCVSIYDIEPLAEDIYFLELINRARANPEAEANLYNIELNEGVNSSSTISNTPKQPLAFNLNLYKAALQHSEDMLEKDYFSHYTFPTNDSPQDRVVAQNYDYYSGENIAINMSTGPLSINQNTAAYHHEMLFVDENWPNRGHRVNMLTNSHKEAGVAFAHGDWEKFPNAVVSTSDFGRGEKSAYICGVIYDDKNNNQFYDVGEGIKNATLTVVETGESVEAFSAGAYSLGISLGGTYTVEAYLCGYNTSTTKTVTIDSENVKLDFLLSDFIYDTEPSDDPVDPSNDPNNPSDNNACKSLSISEVIAPQTVEELESVPVKVSSGNMSELPFSFAKGSFLNIDIALLCYTEPVDAYIAVVFPDGGIYFLSENGRLTSSAFPAFSINSTESNSIALTFSPVPEGYYAIYWAVVPTNGGDIFSVKWESYSELGYFFHLIE